MLKEIYKLYRHIFKLPKMARLELCSLCQLNCTGCYMRNKDSGQTIGSGYLKFDDFKKFLQKNPYIESIETSLSGEIFLNPDFIKIIKYAYQKGVKLTAFNGVNFNTVSDEILEALVKYKFAGITFSIDGASNETYIQYRRNGNFNNVINSIKKLNYFKQKYNSKYPVLVWQFILFDHCRQEFMQAFEFAKELDFSNMYCKFPWSKKNITTKEIYQLHVINSKKIPLKDKEIVTFLNENNMPLCFQPWLAPQINWDGRLLGCCCSTHNDLAINVFNSGLKKALNSKKVKQMREILTGNIPAKNDFACSHCGFYKQMQTSGRYINPDNFKWN